MDKRILIGMAFVLLAFAGCKDTDNASKWVGTYSATSGGLTNSTFNQVVIQQSNDNTVRVALDTILPNQTVYTYVTLQNLTLQSTTSGTINETDSVLRYTQPFLMTGTAVLNGNTLTITGKGVNSVDSILYYFYGTKQ
jgi:hypothetical protein